MWNEVEVLIPMVVSQSKRLASVNEIIIKLSQQCHGVSIRIIPQWYSEPNPKAAFKAIATGLSECSRQWVLYFEDDAELCKNFGEHLISFLPLSDDIGAISFFSSELRDVDFLRAGRVIYNAKRPFVYAQCLLMTRNLALSWANELENWTGHPRSPDNALTPAADKINSNIIISLPSLVQHRKTVSAFGNHSRVISRTFKPDY